MTKTNALRELIMKILKEECPNVYYKQASDNALYPHIVFTLKTVDLDNLNRDDYVLDIDIWHKGAVTYAVEELADNVEKRFKTQNLPQDIVLPTFYLMDRTTVEDSDKSIEHRNLRVQIQNYER